MGATNIIATNKRTKKIIIIVFAALIVLSIIAVTVWFINVATLFSRAPDLMETVFLVVFGIPILLLVLMFALLVAASLVYLIVLITVKAEKFFSIATIITLSVLMIVGAGMITFNLLDSNSIVGVNTREWYLNDSMRLTDDSLFEYRVELVFPFQHNARLKD